MEWGRVKCSAVRGVGQTVLARNSRSTPWDITIHISFAGVGGSMVWLIRRQEIDWSVTFYFVVCFFVTL